MVRLGDVLANELALHGLQQVFMVTGGGAMHLNDALSRCKKFKVCFNHHEQACAMAAEGYARLANIPAVVNVTSGPGGINALNGVYGSYVDSIPMVVISGQIKRDTMLCNVPMSLRQLGDQEVDIISMVRPITKYAVTLQNPSEVKEVIAKAVYLATHGRPGPVWIDVPLDVQSARIEEPTLPTWSVSPQSLLALRGDANLAPNTLQDFIQDSDEELRRKIHLIVERLLHASRPVLMGGTGLHLSGMSDVFRDIVKKLKIPAVCGWNAYDIIPSDFPCYAGRPGTVGDRAGNFTVQNADFLLVLGCRLNIRQVSYNWQSFAQNAWKAHVDVDGAELNKPTLRSDMTIQADLRRFLPILSEYLKDLEPIDEHKEYLAWCKERVEKYPVLQAKHLNSALINPYYFMHKLFEQLYEGDVIVAANATAAVVSNQAGYIKQGVRIFSNSGCASMGYDLPAAIGAALSAKAKRIICLAGDGSIMMNIQELQTIIGNRIPIYIFLLNNAGYLSIRMTQDLYFSDNCVGTGVGNGVSFPDFMVLSKALGFVGERLSTKAELDIAVSSLFKKKSPVFFEIMLDPAQQFEPKLASKVLPDGTMVSPSLDDMAPFLDEDELQCNRICK